MESSISYTVNGKKFHTRTDFLNYCKKQKNGRELFNTAKFEYKGLPTSVDVRQKIDPVMATKKWMDSLKQQGKPIVLMFSGGLDAIFALDLMIRGNCPPDHLLVYTKNIFDNDIFLNAQNVEPQYALRYCKEIIAGNSVMKNTNLWHIHINKADADKHFAEEQWIKQQSFDYTIEGVMPFKTLPHITEKQWKKYVFINGGSVPKSKWVDGKIDSFFVVDRQLCGDLENHSKKHYDFILDNEDMVKYLCTQYYHFIDKEYTGSKEKSLEHMHECHGDHADKRLLEEYRRLIPTMPPQLDKRFDILLPYIEDSEIDTTYPYHAYLHRQYFKAWVLYLEAEFHKPDWFAVYKESFTRNEKYIKEVSTFPGKITLPINIEGR